MRWWREGTPEGRRAVIAAGLGWMLDAFDVTLFALVLPALRKDLGLSTAAGGALGSVALLAAAAGGVWFGWIADRFGRTRALMASILLYSVFTAACGLATTFTQFVLFRIGLGLGMGGEWASGATLVSETWHAEHRGKALAFMQSAWAIGYALAAAVNYLVQPSFGWRAVFFVGILPAFLTIWVRRSVKEPDIWRQSKQDRATRSTLSMLFSSGLAPLTIALTIMNACTLFGWWSFNLWLPSYLQEPSSRGGLGLQMLSSSTMILVMQLGMWFGYITFGFVSDRIGRKRTYIAYLLLAAVLLFLYVSVRAPLVLLALGPLVAFFATGYFSGFGAVTAEIFPTSIRGTAQGFTYNVGRIVSAAAPFAVGTLAQTQGFGTALSISSLAFLMAALAWKWIPETRGRALA
ncbi:MAG TPA: MFS transporter [Vicinamibacterales bacterium]|nr:MFS transporter [Vicinamibacterales bacterium]